MQQRSTPFGILALVSKMWLSVNPVSHGAIVSTLTFLFMLLLTIHNIFVPTVFSEDNYMYWNVCFWYPSKYCMTKCFAWLIHLSPLLSRLICAILGDRLSNSPSHWRILYIRLKSIPPQSLYQFLLLAVVKLLHLILFVLIMHILRHVQSRSLLPHDSTSSLSFFPSPSWFFIQTPPCTPGRVSNNGTQVRKNAPLNTEWVLRFTIAIALVRTNAHRKIMLINFCSLNIG